MSGKTLCAAVAAALCLAAAPAIAHHAFAAEFDEKKPITLTGKVVEMRWSNPHAWIYLDVAGPGGKSERWAFETGAANGLFRRGWRKEKSARRHRARDSGLAGAERNEHGQRRQHHLPGRPAPVRRIVEPERRDSEVGSPAISCCGAPAPGAARRLHRRFQQHPPPPLRRLSDRAPLTPCPR